MCQDKVMLTKPGIDADVIFPAMANDIITESPPLTNFLLLRHCHSCQIFVHRLFEPMPTMYNVPVQPAWNTELPLSIHICPHLPNGRA